MNCIFRPPWSYPGNEFLPINDTIDHRVRRRLSKNVLLAIFLNLPDDSLLAKSHQNVSAVLPHKFCRSHDLIDRKESVAFKYGCTDSPDSIHLMSFAETDLSLFLLAIYSDL